MHVALCYLHCHGLKAARFVDNVVTVARTVTDLYRGCRIVPKKKISCGVVSLVQFYKHGTSPPAFCFSPSLLRLLLSRFFRELNSQLLRTMLEAVDREDHLLTVDMLESVGLDPTKDRNFLTELAAQLNFNLNVQRPSDMVDLLSCCC